MSVSTQAGTSSLSTAIGSGSSGSRRRTPVARARQCLKDALKAVSRSATLPAFMKSFMKAATIAASIVLATSLPEIAGSPRMAPAYDTKVIR
ncbi:hypothetical protein CLV68_3043 [Actinokineospora cianjurensis]|uniref:Uncharacterized protein n=1 Tax=Actinokineospora cianjurensis TaxID=585224 RepID=A0A421B2E2_9PSEU|nr:hypothetical protein CLV68_3043 [Actinokineospora cianjurensis]